MVHVPLAPPKFGENKRDEQRQDKSFQQNAISVQSVDTISNFSQVL